MMEKEEKKQIFKIATPELELSRDSVSSFIDLSAFVF